MIVGKADAERFAMPPGAPLTVLTTNHFWNKLVSLETYKGSWRPFLVCLIVLLMYTPVLVRMASQFYGDPSYSHAFFIPLFSGYLIWQRRRKLESIEKKPSMMGLAIVIGAICLLYLGSVGAELFLTRISLVLVIIGLILYFWGAKTLRELTFPIGFLFLMIPLPAIVYNRMVFPLQLLSSRFASRTLETMNLFPVLREGNLLILPHCTLEVVEACSGIRSLMSLVALALGYGYVAENSIAARSLLTIAMIPVSIVGNGCRVVLAALLAYYRGSDTVESYLHPVSSVVIFLVAAIALLVLHGVITLLRRRWRPNRSS